VTGLGTGMLIAGVVGVTWASLQLLIDLLSLGMIASFIRGYKTQIT